jgi:hypothetical protein
VPLAEHDGVIHALAPDGSDQPLDKRTLPWRLCGDDDLLVLVFSGPEDRPDAVRDFVRQTDLAKIKALLPQHSHGIAASRLKSCGVGPLASVATNDADEDRARNRRVNGCISSHPSQPSRANPAVPATGEGL